MIRGGLVCVACAVAMGASARAPDAGVSNLAPVFRFWDGQRHFYTLDEAEADRRRFTEEGRPILLYRTAPDSNFVRLFRCYVPDLGAHFVSRDPRCEGAVVERPYGYASATPRPGFSPLYALYSSELGGQVVTTNYGEGASHGYAFEALLGYVP